MQASRFSALFLLAIAALVIPRAARADEDWQKTYPVAAQPSLTFSTGDSAAEVHSCGECREIRVRIEWNDRHAFDYNIGEFQSGGHVNFELHEKVRFGVHWGAMRSPRVTFETPAHIDLQARTSDGALKVFGVGGNLDLHTSDGSVDVADTTGALHLQASDGSIRIHDVAGTLESRSSDGSVQINGRFSAVQVHTSDGSLDLALDQGSKLDTASRVEASDGSVRIHLPSTLAADIEVHTGDGHVDCNLPLVLNGYHSSGDSHHNLSGRLNGGGVPLNIQTHDGNVVIAAL
jgi:hypothetical protein